MDRHTVFLMQGGLLLFLAGLLGATFRQQRRLQGDRSADWAALAFLCAGLGMVLQSYRGSASPVLTIILGNGIFILFGAFFDLALARATKSHHDHLAPLLLLDLAVIANFSYFTFVDPAVLLRTVEAFGVMVVQYVAIMSHAWSNRNEIIRPALRALIGFYSLHIAVNLVRIVGVVHLRQADAWFSCFGVVTITGIAVSFLAIFLMQRESDLRLTAATDPLTGFLNRRGLEDAAGREWNRARRTSYGIAALSIDVDDFKLVNDSYGHAAGDQVLTSLAAVLRSNVRGYDVLARLGGDEFFALLPGCSHEKAEEISARVRMIVSNLQLTSFYGVCFRFSISVGVSHTDLPDCALEELLHQGDILLYKQKRSLWKGGNRDKTAASEFAEAKYAFDLKGSQGQ